MALSEQFPAQYLTQVGKLFQAAQMCHASVRFAKSVVTMALSEQFPAQFLTQVGDLFQAAQMCQASVR